MTRVICVLEPADDRGRGADQFGQLSLTETYLCPQSGDFARNVIVSPSRLQLSQSIRFTSVVTAVQNLHRISGRFSLVLDIINPPYRVPKRGVDIIRQRRIDGR